MACTELFMTALIPELGVLPSIGSASENASRNENTTYHQHIFHSSEAESIRSVFGDVAYSKYIEHESREREKQISKDLRDLEDLTHRTVHLRSKSKFRRWLGWLKAAYTKDSNSYCTSPGSIRDIRTEAFSGVSL